MNCPQCGTDLPSDAAFCLQCGAQVGEVPATPEDQLLSALETAIGSHYEILRLLGRGGMGAVYLGRDRALDRLVAIKVLPPESTDPESIERFRREARTAANLNHPNIVPLYTFGEGEGILYFVMSAIILIPVGLFGLVAGEGEGRLGGIFILFMPLLYGVLSFVMIALVCFLYNVIAGKVGGFAIEFDSE